MRRSWQLLHNGISCCTQGHDAKMQHKPITHSHDTPSSTVSFISVFLGLPKLFGSPRGIPEIGKPVRQGMGCLARSQHE